MSDQLLSVILPTLMQMQGAIGGIEAKLESLDGVQSDVERLKGQMDIIISKLGASSVSIQSESIRNIGVAEGGSKVEQSNG